MSELLIEKARETRSDRAERTFHVDGAPPVEYRATGTWRKPEPEERRWIVQTVAFAWDRGVLTRVALRGVRLKKDGRPGRLREGMHYRRDRESGLWVGDAFTSNVVLTEPPAWLTALIKSNEHDVPPFDAPDAE